MAWWNQPKKSWICLNLLICKSKARKGTDVRVCKVYIIACKIINMGLVLIFCLCFRTDFLSFEVMPKENLCLTSESSFYDLLMSHVAITCQPKKHVKLLAITMTCEIIRDIEVLNNTTKYCLIFHSKAQYRPVLSNIVQYCPVISNIVQYCSILFK